MSQPAPSQEEIGALAPLIEAVLDPALIVDARGGILAWNGFAAASFGWSKEEAVGRAMLELIIPEAYRKPKSPYLLREKDGGISDQRADIITMHRDGRKLPMEMSTAAVPGTNRAMFMVILRDLSQRRTNEQRLALSEESLRLATEAAEVGTWDFDVPNNILNCCRRTRAMFGIFDDSPCTNVDFYARLHPDDHAETARRFAATLDPELRSNYDVEYRTTGRDDGVVRWIAAKGKGVFDRRGRCIRAVGATIDITARKQAEARNLFMQELKDVLRRTNVETALRDACEMMGRFFDTSRVGFGTLDPSGDYLDFPVCWSAEGIRPLIGRLPSATFGRRIVKKLNDGETVVIDNLARAAIADDVDLTLGGQEIHTRAILVVPFVRAGRLRSIVYLNNREPRAWSSEDIAFMEQVAERTSESIARNEAEEALRALNASLEARVEERTAALHATEDALRQAQKMEAVGQLTGGIAHDFNNLLTVIMGNIDMATRRLPDNVDDRARRAIENAQRGAERAATLTQRLLAFSRRQPLKPKPTRIDELITGMSELLARAIGETVRIQTTAPPDTWPVEIDPSQLENSLLNLAVNARDAMPDGGHLVIGATNQVVSTSNLADHSGIDPGAYVVITVSDTGTGMTEDVAARAFEPFFTTKDVGKGTGLGLSMVYGFVKQSGGDTIIRSAVGQGTTVSLYLPRMFGRNVEHPVVIEARGDFGTAHETVLVVEDDASVRHLSVSSLSELGYHVHEAADGPAALRLIEEQPIDLIFTDMVMPGMSGLELARSVRSARPDIHILFTSGYARSEGAPLDPGYDLLQKPFTFHQLAKKIRETLDKE
ncbi:PAS domain S-box-containing protein [Sphingomonas sp. YR710]|uniref:PAS domain S-box protein n=1 Tax=Sphingomonas sp. YR710 TaxID=1882773 RepID=UPI0008826BAA|nr:PAS domain S-box protein [Sphingomonas sp. YR710]SDC97417.1 PAS domain S-box-containing protein [Sphingomonas sp. YR710]